MSEALTSELDTVTMIAGSSIDPHGSIESSHIASFP